MKKVMNVSLGGRSFTLDEDAYKRLDTYLQHFRAKLTVNEPQTTEVMDEIEGRIAEIFYQEVGAGNRVVTLEMVEKMSRELGMPDGSTESAGVNATAGPETPVKKKLYRDTFNKDIAGVCSGLAIYLDIDVVLVRVLMLVALICGSAGFWIYIILWIAVPKADTPAKKCEMYGVPASAENLSRYTQGYKK